MLRDCSDRIPASPHGAWPIATCDGPVGIDLGAQPVRLLPQRPSHLVVHLPSANVLVMGDLLTTGGYPVIDESSGGTLPGMIEAIEGLLPLVDCDTVIVPGHGAMADRDGVLGFLDMLRTIEGRVLPLIAETSPLPRSLPPRRPRSSTRAEGPDTSPGRSSPEWSSLASA